MKSLTKQILANPMYLHTAIADSVKTIYYVGTNPVSPRKGWLVASNNGMYLVIDEATKSVVTTNMVFDDIETCKGATIVHLQEEIRELTEKAIKANKA